MNVLQTIKDRLKFSSLRRFIEGSSTFKKEDLKVLVLGEYNEVLELPINEIGGSGGSQNLQQTLDNGNYAEVDGGNSYVHFLAGDSSNRYIILRVENDVEGSDITMTTEQIILSNSEESGLSARIGISNGLISFRQSDYINNKTSLVRFATPILNNDESVIYEIPAKPAQYEVDGITSIPYKLATEDSITLQGTLENGTNASFDGGDNTADILTTLSGTRKRVTFVTSTSGFGTSQFSVHDQLAILSNNTGSNLGGSFSVANGLSKIQQDNGSVGTTVQFNTPTSASVLNFPAPSIAGDYTFALREDLPPTIHIIETGDFTIPDGTKTRIITLKENANQDVIFPAIGDSVGSIYFVTNRSSDGTSTVTINSKTGSNDFFDGGVSVNTKVLTFGMSLRFFNDGETFTIIG